MAAQRKNKYRKVKQTLWHKEQVTGKLPSLPYLWIPKYSCLLRLTILFRHQTLLKLSAKFQTFLSYHHWETELLSLMHSWKKKPKKIANPAIVIYFFYISCKYQTVNTLKETMKNQSIYFKLNPSTIWGFILLFSKSL